MDIISSDTNVWFDFHSISRVSLPFRLPVSYIMSRDAMRAEIVSPPELLEKLEELGLRGVELSYEELFYVESLKRKYVRLSVFDRGALAIAKNRNILLLTGDRALKNAAEKEGVKVVGTIGLLDRLYREQLIDVGEYRYCLTALESSQERRMPVDELRKRLRNIP